MISGVLFIGFLVLYLSFQTEQAYDLAALDHETIEELLLIDPSQIDVCTAGLLVVKATDMDISVHDLRTRVDFHARRVEPKLREKSEPKYKLDALIEYVNSCLLEGYSLNWRPDQILMTRKGNCLGSVWLYLSLAERLELSLSAVRMPNHILLAMPCSGDAILFVETTTGGTYLKGDELMRKFKINEQDIENGIYCSVLSKKQIIATLLNNLAHDISDYENSMNIIELAKMFDNNYPELYVTAAGKLVAKGEYDKAEESVHTALSMTDSLHSSFTMLGRIQQLRGCDDEAVIFYHRALGLQIEDVKAHQGLAEIYIGQNETEKAILHASKILDYDAQSSDAYLLLGRANAKKGRFAEAQRSFMQSLKYDPQNYLAHKLLGFVFAEQRKFFQAIEHFELARQITEDDSSLNSVLGAMYIETADYAKAIDILSSVTKIQPDNMESLANLFVAYLHSEQFREAIEISNRLRENHFTDARIDMGLAICHTKLGNASNAIDAFEKLESRNPDNLNINRVVIMLCLELKEYELACKKIITYLDKYPSNNDMRIKLVQIYVELGDIASARKQMEAIRDRGGQIPDFLEDLLDSLH